MILWQKQENPNGQNEHQEHHGHPENQGASDNMSLFPEFLPIINEGMSVITAICLFFLGTGMIVIFKFLFSMCKNHDKVINDIWEDLTIMKVDIAETSTVVKGIDQSLSELGNANKEIIKILLKK